MESDNPLLHPRRTATRVWSERLAPDRVVFRYEASVETFVNDQPFEAKRVDGTIPRSWI